MNLHPAIVHFPIALLYAAWLLYIVHMLKVDKRPWGFVAQCALIGGAVMLVASLLTGSMAEDNVAKGSAAAEVLSDHELGGYIVTWLTMMLAGWSGWRQSQWKRAELGGFIGLLTLLVALMTYSALLGGSLVYEHGIGVTLPAVIPS
ncbi:MAG: DUF2231 domain-containing protein [Bacteroidia bacterium]